MIRSKVRKAFTLVEILIVVVILGILAAIVIPQFTNATQDAQAGNIIAQLRTLQSQIELFAARHNGAYPGGASPTDTTFWDDLTDRNTAGTPDAYLKEVPSNPAFPGTDAQRKTVTFANATGSATGGWVWNTTDHKIYASYFIEATGKVSTTATD